MSPRGASLIGRVIEIPVLLTALVSVGCVDLRKPELVQKCSAAGNCSDEPPPSPGPDAAPDGELPGPDLPVVDKPLPPSDVSDAPVADSADQGGQGPDTRDVTAADKEPDGRPADVEPDAPADRRLDTGPDVGPDLADGRPDLADLRNDVGPDIGPDLPPDTSTLLTGLLAYYKCESATGTSLPDSSGKGHDGTLTASGYSFAAGKVGKALSLARASQGYVTLPPAMFAGLTDITLTAWVNVTTAQNWQRVFDVGVDAKQATNPRTGTRYMNLVPKNDGTNLVFSISKDGYDNEQKLTSAALATSTWKHVAVVLGSSGGLYVDGTLVTSASTITLRPTDLGTIDYAYLGKSQFTSDPYFDGLLDEVRIYDRALTSAEVKALQQFTGP